MASTHRLILQSGAGSGVEYPLEKYDLFLGRDNNNDVVVNDPEVSRRHARLTLDGDTYRIEDLGSTNGTFIRGQRLTAPVVLRPGEIITLGEKVVLRYEAGSADSNATVVVQRGAGAVKSPVTPAPPPPAAPLPVTPPPPAQAYPSIPAIPATPAYPPMPAAAPKKKNKGLIVVLVIVAILVVLCIIPLIIIDATNSYCALFPGILNMMFTGACP